jgi:16S rRNA (uracil1498-N3)-methyltransferase
MPRLYVDGPLQVGEILRLPEASSRHLQVLRAQPGDTVQLFNDAGQRVTARVVVMGRRNVEVALETIDPDPGTESPLRLTLLQALSAAERMDYTVQKATELGVTTIQIVQSAHCAYRLAADRLDKRLAHWRGVAIAAAEQCGRTVVPKIQPPVSFSAALAQAADADLKLLLSPLAGVAFADLPAKAHNVAVLIGPEGGFSDAEEAEARAAGYTALRLGPRIFRTETVAPVIAALLQSRYGDF